MAKSAHRSSKGAAGRGAEGRAPVARLAAAAALTAASVFLLVALLTFDPADPPTHAFYPANTPVQNLCGPVGAWAAYHLIRVLGIGAWVLTVFLVLHALLSIAGKRIPFAPVRLVGVVMIAAAAAAFQAMLAPASGSLPGLSGGILGQWAWAELGARFGPVGTGVWLALLLAIGAIVALDKWIIMAPAWIIGVGGPVARRAGTAVSAAAAGAGRVGGDLVSGLAERARPSAGGAGAGGAGAGPRMDDLDDAADEGRAPEGEEIPVASLVRDDEHEDASGRADEDGSDDGAITLDEDEDAELEALYEPAAAADDEDADDDEPAHERRGMAPGAYDDDEDDTPGAPQVFDSEALRAKIAKLPIVFGHETRRVATEADLRDLQGVADLPGYRFPGLDLLEEPEANFSERLEEFVREQAMALESALRQYRIDGEVTDIESGPVITLFHVKLAPGTKVAALSAVSSDIARALKAVNIRIVSNMAGRDTVGIEVPNTQKEKVRLKELMGKSERFARMKLPMFLGKDAAGEPLIADLTQMPHMLIAGTTGSGKSVAMNTIIMGFLYTKKPSELKLVLVDPKMVEMSQFKDIPHLMCPVVTEMGKAAAILEWATQKMDERYELLAEAGCRDIAAYNDLPWEELRERFNPASPEEEARIPRRLPYMVFVIDELADLIITTKEVENSIIRIAQKARAVGIHLILATQRPQANVVTGLIKSNMPCRICFKVASGMDSRIVLDQKGGELLLGQGDMLYLSPRTSKLVRAQGTLVDDQEIRKVVRFMRDVAGPSFERQLMQIRAGGSLSEDEEKVLKSENNSSASLAAAREDPMFPRAVEIVLETRRGSVSLLQRRLAIGYTRASRLIDLMGIAGIISDHKGSVARDVLITLEEWAAMKAQVERDLAAEQAAGGGGAGQPQLFDQGSSDAAEATAVLDATEEAAAREDEDEFPDAFRDEPEEEGPASERAGGL
jgi:S-DNA-T family DNA segregation ATPase FtsK/SpoIIIE